MDPVRNPYSPGAGSPPPALVGRDSELDQFDIAVQRFGVGRPARSLILTGFRGVGKTALLGRFGKIAKHHNWVHQQLEATEDLEFAEAIASLVRKALWRLSAVRKLHHGFGVLRSFELRWNLGEGPAIGVKVEPTRGIADSGYLEQDLADLFVEVGELARDRSTGVLFTIDEIQYLSQRDLAALIVGAHRISQEQLPLMVAGAGLPSIPALAGAAKSYAERLFVFREIASLDQAEASAALGDPAEAEGVHWNPDALAEVVTGTEGHPYFLQEFGKQIWDAATGPDAITSADVKAGVPIAVEELDTGFFRVRFDRTTGAERAYLAAMASLSSGPYGSGAVAKAMGKTTTQAGPLRDSLIKRGLCYSPRHGVIAFTVPMFDDFLRRRGW